MSVLFRTVERSEIGPFTPHRLLLAVVSVALLNGCNCGQPLADAGPEPETDAGGQPEPDAGPQPEPDAGPIAACGDVPVLVADGPSVSGTLSARDDFRGSCSSLFVGADAVVEFTAPAAGRYRFSTAGGADLDTVLYLRDQCRDAETEIACNDNAGATGLSVVIVDLEADQTIFVIVDSFAGLEESAFTLNIAEVDVHAPVLSTVIAFYNADANVLAFTATGTDDGSDVRRGRLSLLGANDTPLPISGSTEPFEFDLDTAAVSDLEIDGTAFTVSFAAALGVESTGVEAVRFSVVDEQEEASETVQSSTGVPAVATIGDPCDTAGGFNLCVERSRCRPDDLGLNATCEAATAPAITSAVGFYDPTLRAVGVEFDGSDAEEDALFAQIELLDGLGNPLQMLDGNGQLVDAPSLLSFLNIVTPGPTFSATASARINEAIPLADLASASLRLIDDAGLESAPVAVTFGPPVLVDSGGSCDVPGALNQCPAGEICASETANAPACLAEGSGCPVAWTPVALEDFSTGGAHVFEVAGTNDAAENVAGRATCGGGGPQSVFSFTPNATDRWRFSTSSADPDADTLLFVRRECAASQPEFELACNDDNFAGERLSSVEVSLIAGVPVFVVVDGYYNPSLGFDGFDAAFTLTARRLFQ